MHSLKSRTTVAVALIALVSRSLAAQEPQCSMANPNATAACNTAVDAIRAFHPLAGMIVSGGNPVLGTSGSLGGIGHLTVTARRSEEHTSELQSPCNLVCRLLLEKKKKKT